MSIMAVTNSVKNLLTEFTKRTFQQKVHFAVAGFKKLNLNSGNFEIGFRSYLPPFPSW